MVTKEEGINLEFGINRCTFYIQKKTTRTYSIAQGKQLKCPSDEWIKKLWCVYIYIHTHTMEYYLAIKKNEIMPFTNTWMDLEIIILNEISQKEKDKYHMISLICGIKKIQMNLFTKQKQTHRHRKQTYGYQRGKGMEDG